MPKFSHSKAALNLASRVDNDDDDEEDDEVPRCNILGRASESVKEDGFEAERVGEDVMGAQDSKVG